MKHLISTLLSVVLVVGGISAFSTAGATDVVEADAAKSKWMVSCNSKNKDCSLLSDGKGKTSSNNPKEIYPNDVDPSKIEIRIYTDQKGTGNEGERCTWQWVYLGGQWRYLCVRDTDTQ